MPETFVKQIGAHLIQVVVQKESRQLDKKSDQLAGEVKGYPWPYPFDVLARLPKLHPWHSRCTEVIASAAVGIGYDLMEKNEKAESTARKELEALVPDDSFAGFCSFAVAAMLDTGNGYIEVARDRTRKVAELYHMPPQTIWIKKDNSGFVHKVETGSNTVDFAKFGKAAGDQNELIHIKTPDLESRHYGLPRWLSVVRAIDLDNNAIDYNTAFFANGAIPALALIVEGGEFSPEVEDAVKKFFTESFKGTANAHKTIYIPVPDPNVKVRLEPIGEAVRDASFHQLRMDNRDEVIGARGVPPRILGIMSAGSLGGGGEVAGQLQVFDQVTLQPIREKVAKVLNKTIIADLGLPEIAFRKLDITTGKEDAESLAALVQARIITQEEARGDLGYEGAPPGEEDDLKKMLAKMEKELFA